MIRVAAGVAAVFAIVVAGGPGAVVASADPGSPRSSSGQSPDGGRGDGNGPRGHQERGSRDGAGHGSQRRGSGREPGGQRGQARGDGGDQSTGVTPRRGTSDVAVAETTTASRGVVVESAAPTVVPAAPTVVPVAPTVPVQRAGPAESVPGPIGQSAMEITVPLVTIGDGRLPGPPSERPGELPGGQTSPGPAVPQPLTTIAAPPARSSMAPPQPSLTAESDPWPLFKTPVASFWGTVQPGWAAGVLFGVAGLLLAPIAGVWLGHRQARAVKAASQLVGH